MRNNIVKYKNNTYKLHNGEWFIKAGEEGMYLSKVHNEDVLEALNLIIEEGE